MDAIYSSETSVELHGGVTEYKNPSCSSKTEEMLSHSQIPFPIQPNLSQRIPLRLRHAVAYLVEALCYKPEGRGFESR
jgi:hypothetical protein